VAQNCQFFVQPSHLAPLKTFVSQLSYFLPVLWKTTKYSLGSLEAWNWTTRADRGRPCS